MSYSGGAKEVQLADFYQKKRIKEERELEERKRKIQDDLKIGTISNKFSAHYDAVEQKLKNDTVGLVTLDEMKEKQQQLIESRERELVKKDEALRAKQRKAAEKLQIEKVAKQSLLSFDDDEYDDADDDDSDAKPEDDDSELKPDVDIKGEIMERDLLTVDPSQACYNEPKRKRLGMDPSVDTSFLPDRDREDEENKLRSDLINEWKDAQDRLKLEEITIVYSYWDGSGHKRTCEMKKGNTIEQLLGKVCDRLKDDFSDLKGVSCDQLMYVKEDLIIPHHYSFYDFIVTRAQGKSGPLFEFGDDSVALIHGQHVDKDESHAGKVCLRTWYERNKHIFPANRWEPYNPSKKWTKTKDRHGSAKITVK